jgi:acyl-CoA dehydrogenase
MMLNMVAFLMQMPFMYVAAIEMAKAGSGGVHISLMIHSIGTPPIHHFARPEIRDEVMPQIIAGEKISALAITEPSGGSDVAAIKNKSSS